MFNKVIQILLLSLIIFIHKVYSQTRFAVIGDYGKHSNAQLDVANLVKSWNIDFIVTTGDNSYGSNSLDYNIGYYYADFIYPYQGSYGQDTATVNRFWATIGNHDYSDGGGINSYLNYFTYPNNERYYDIVIDNIHFFMINSPPAEPDGETENSVQGQWMTARMTECYTNHNHWRVAAFHHPPYSSGNHGSITYMRWNFQNYGIQVVLNGHDHTYERLTKNDVLYFVNGLGGKSIYSFGNPLPESQFRYNGDYGAQLVTANGSELKMEFYNRSGELIDSYTITNTGLPPELLSATINTPNQVTLSFSKSLYSQSAQNESNYSIDNGINVLSASLSSNNRDVTLTTSEHSPNQQYTLTVSNVTDHSGNVISSQANSAQYLLEADTTPPELTGAALVENYFNLTLLFSEQLESNSASEANNYLIDNGVQVISAELLADQMVVQLVTTEHTQGQSYQVVVSNVTDLAGNMISSSSNSAQYEAISNPVDLVKFDIISVTASSTSNPNYHAGLTIDGLGINEDPNSRWAAIPMPEHLIFDLGESKVFAQSKFSFYGFEFGRIYTYSVLVSNDNTNWTEVLTDRQSALEEWSTEIFAPVSGRFIKLLFITSNQATQGQEWAHLWEAEILGPDQISGAETEGEVLTKYELSQNYPNPFNPTTRIQVGIPEQSIISLIVYNALGQEVIKLVEGVNVTAGIYEYEWDASDVPSGIYFYRLETNRYSATKKMLLIK